MTLTLGDTEILRVEELTLPVPLALLGADSQLVADNLHWLAPRFLNRATQTFPLVFQSWIVRRQDFVLVIDPCNGNGRSRPAMPHFSHLQTPFLERFESTGVKPDEVDLVFCTHLHCDHCGWNTHLRDGRWVPTFPNARYVFVRREVLRWDPRRADHRVIDYNVGVFEESVLPVIEAGLATLVDDHQELAPGLTIEAAHGHTAGHSMLRMATKGGEVVFTGDAFHHPLQVLNTGLHLDGCDDLIAATRTRDRLCALLADRGALMLPAHFPAPHGGRVLRDRDAFLFSPSSA